MWISKELWQRVVANEEFLGKRLRAVELDHAKSNEECRNLSIQKHKDDQLIDWLRQRINQLELDKAVLLRKTADLHVPVPELQPRAPRPGAMSEDPSHLMLQAADPSIFEDMGEENALRAGIVHDGEGKVVYDEKRAKELFHALREEQQAFAREGGARA